MSLDQNRHIPLDQYRDVFADLPWPDEHCQLSIAIPVCNEEESIEACLQGLYQQVDLDGQKLDLRFYEVIVFANNCIDATVERLQAFQNRYPDFALHIVSTCRLGIHPGSVGRARAAVMNACVERMSAFNRRGLIASTDGDSVVHRDWVIQNAQALMRSDAVGGRILPVLHHEPLMPDIHNGVLRLEHQWRYALVQLETLLDPVAHDPWPRHGNHQGASLAMHAEVYQAVGGIPECDVLEDMRLYQAIVRHDYRFRHSLSVRVKTSVRRDSRVSGGFAADLAAMDEHVLGHKIFMVEHPEYWMRLFAGRQALRNHRFADAAQIWGIEERLIQQMWNAFQSFGHTCASAEQLAAEHGHLRYVPQMPIDVALDYTENYFQGRVYNADFATLKVA